nr:hypothetical protein [Tanacetum cinerariifolium]
MGCSSGLSTWVFVTQQDENVIDKEVDVAQVQVTTIATTSTISINEATLAQALVELKHAKPKTKAKGIVFHEPEESTTTTIPKPKSQVKEKNYRTELVEETSKKAEAEVIEASSMRAATKLEQESSKKKKIDDDKDTTKLKQLVKIIPNEEGVAIDVIPLAVKPSSIVD